MVAPAELVRSMKKDFRVRPPTRKFRPEEIDRFQGKVARAVLKKLDAICARLPETERGTRFGSPMWKAGKKTFVTAHYYTGRLKLSFWVGARGRRSSSRTSDYEISHYTGHNGWIDLDVEERAGLGRDRAARARELSAFCAEADAEGVWMRGEERGARMPELPGATGFASGTQRFCPKHRGERVSQVLAWVRFRFRRVGRGPIKSRRKSRVFAPTGSGPTYCAFSRSATMLGRTKLGAFCQSARSATGSPTWKAG